MNSLFYWAIQHSDPTKLKQLSQEASSDTNSAEQAQRELLKQKAKILFGGKSTDENNDDNNIDSDNAENHQPSSITRRMIDPIQHMKNQLAVLSKSKDVRRQEGVTNEDMFNCLVRLQDVIDKIDFANDFHKLDGTRVMLQILNEYLATDRVQYDDNDNSNNGNNIDEKQQEIREQYALAIEAVDNMITCLHNNPWLQTQEVFQKEAFPFIMRLLSVDSGKDGVVTEYRAQSRLVEKLVSLLSALCSNQPVSLVRFLELEGIQTLVVPLVKRNVEALDDRTTDAEFRNKLTTKLLFLLFNLMVCEESLPQKTNLATQILLYFDDLILCPLEQYGNLRSDSEIDLIEKALLVLRDLAMADHVKSLYVQTTKANARLSNALDHIMRSALAHEDQDRVYDVKDYIEEIKSY